MKYLLFVAITFIAIISPVFAVDSITISARFGDITFNHSSHSFSCGTCHHTAKPGKISLDKKSGHHLCKGCHENRKSGPIRCAGCHRKKRIITINQGDA